MSIWQWAQYIGYSKLFTYSFFALLLKVRGKEVGGCIVPRVGSL